MPTANEIRYMVMHPGPDREFAEWGKSKKLRWSAWTAEAPTIQ